ncbi:eg45-like domain containing protein 2 [Quercus suber]|uniref:Eg45-like domain containing protein 2 n=1 Tax=Quercus suber TaxID=58331 RepID=A0AAW0IX93_QUESU
MHRSQPCLQGLSLMFLIPLFFNFHTSYGDVGTAALYSPPYLSTACYGSNTSQFPSSKFFAAAGHGIWDEGAACGRQYFVRCISDLTLDACNQNHTIQITIVDHMGQEASVPSAYNTTMFLSTTAFGTIANSSTISSPYINIEFQQYEVQPVNPNTEERKNQSLSSSTFSALIKEQNEPNKGEISRGLPVSYSPHSHIRNHEISAGQRVHSGEHVSLGRGPVPPSAPNAPTYGP